MTALATPPAKKLVTPAPSHEMHREIWRDLRWEPHPLQRKALLSKARRCVLAAGRRAGKSQVGGHRLLPEAYRAMIELSKLQALRLRREYWIVGPEYSDSEKEFRVVWDGLERLGFRFDKPGSYNNPLSGEMRVSLFGGRFIVWAKSAKYPGTLVGEGLSGVVFSEAAKLKPSIWDKFIMPTLADFDGWAFFGSTPEGRNWFYDAWNNGQDAFLTDWDSWRAPAWSNPHVYPVGVNAEVLGRVRLALADRTFRDNKALQAEAKELIDPTIMAMLLTQSAEMFGQEVAAEFNEFVGRVFKDFDEEIHVVKQDIGLRRDWQTFACVDYGFTNPFVWLLIQVDPHGERIHVVDEYYETQRTTREAAAEIESRGLAPNSGDCRVLRFFPDPAEPDRTRELSSHLGLPFGGHTGGPIDDRLEWIRRKLKRPGLPGLPYDHPERQPWLTFNRRCKNTIREMGAYKYPETAEQADAKNRAAPEAPLKKDDHAPEALGRFMAGYYGKPSREAGGIVVSRAVMGRAGRVVSRRGR